MGQNEADLRAFLQRFIAQQAAVPRRKFQLAITLPGGRLIGNCGIREERAGAREGSLGYELNPDFWGQGYATEAARSMLALGFRELGFHRVYAECLAANTGSAHVLEKLGMRQEGRLRENTWLHNQWWDTLIYSILEDEWRSLLPN
jgi:RimJ/RimL family protein N-acetyltransferase